MIHKTDIGEENDSHLVSVPLIILHFLTLFNNLFVFYNLRGQILEFDLRGIPLDSSSSLTIVVKDFETIGQNK